MDIGFGILRKQAQKYIHEGIKSVRLVVTDTTETEILVEEATDGEEWGPSSSTMAKIASAAVYADECMRIIGVIQQRLELSLRGNGGVYWRQVYKTLVVVEYLLGHGPRYLALAMGQVLRELVEGLRAFEYRNVQGLDQGQNVRIKAERVLQLLADPEALARERDKAQRLAREIKGFGGRAFSKAYKKQGLGPCASLPASLKYAKFRAEAAAAAAEEEQEQEEEAVAAATAGEGGEAAARYHPAPSSTSSSPLVSPAPSPSPSVPGGGAATSSRRSLDLGHSETPSTSYSRAPPSYGAGGERQKEGQRRGRGHGEVEGLAAAVAAGDVSQVAAGQRFGGERSSSSSPSKSDLSGNHGGGSGGGGGALKPGGRLSSSQLVSSKLSGSGSASTRRSQGQEWDPFGLRGKQKSGGALASLWLDADYGTESAPETPSMTPTSVLESSRLPKPWHAAVHHPEAPPGMVGVLVPPLGLSREVLEFADRWRRQEDPAGSSGSGSGGDDEPEQGATIPEAAPAGGEEGQMGGHYGRGGGDGRDSGEEGGGRVAKPKQRPVPPRLTVDVELAELAVDETLPSVPQSCPVTAAAPLGAPFPRPRLAPPPRPASSFLRELPRDAWQGQEQGQEGQGAQAQASSSRRTSGEADARSLPLSLLDMDVCGPCAVTR